jgi:hypothetical protein
VHYKKNCAEAEVIQNRGIEHNLNKGHGIDNISGSNLAVVKLVTVQVTAAVVEKDKEGRHDLPCKA